MMQDGNHRFADLISRLMSNLHLPSLLDSTSSEKIHVWMRPLPNISAAGQTAQSSAALSSVSVENADAAIACYAAGASI